MANEQNVNSIARKIGLSLINTGSNILRMAFNLTPTVILGGQIRNVLTGMFPNLKDNITLSDGKYRLLPLSQWHDIIAVDWTDQKKWLAEFYDCDNFAFYFSSNIARLFEINSAGVVHGHVYDKNGKWLYGHFWNLIITDNLNLYFYEPDSDLYVKYVPGQKTIIGNKEYRPLTFRFF